MIAGIGTDIVKVNRIQESLHRYGDKFARRILSETEMQSFLQSGKKSHFLAKRFAAKEAAAKAMGTGFRGGLSLRDIEVTNNDHGRPLLRFSGIAHSLLLQRNINRWHISLTDEIEYAVAFVVLESEHISQNSSIL